MASLIRAAMLDGFVLAGEAFAEHDEFVAAEAGQGVARPQRRSESARHGQQHVVTGGVAEAVVDDLEPIDVDEQKPDRAVGAIESARASG